MKPPFLSLKRTRVFSSVPDIGVTAVERISGFPRLNKLMQELDNDIEPALRTLEEICGVYSISGLENIPASGPVAFVANHPLGGADIVAAFRLLERLERPYRILANRTISVPKAFEGRVIPVDVYGDSQANSRPIRSIMTGWGKEFDNLFVFPARRCSRFDYRSWQIRDLTWHPGFISLAERKEAAICPVHFSGRNSVLFYILALIFGDLAGLRLPSEFFRFHSGGLDCDVRETFRAREKSESIDAYANAVRQSVERVLDREGGASVRS